MSIDGRSKHPLYGSWGAMIGRCHNPNHSSYGRYGSRGIYVCDRWREDFRAFLADMGERPKGMTLDRIDPLGPYAPENCRWATIKEQRQNITPEGDQRMRSAMSEAVKNRWQKWREAGSPPLPPRSGGKLSIDQVIRIREQVAAGLLQREIAEAFNVSIATISDIVCGKTHRHGATKPEYLRRAVRALE